MPPQSRKKNPACHRAGSKEKKEKLFREKFHYFKALKNKKLAKLRNDSLFEKHRQGKSFTAAEKQIAVNVVEMVKEEGCKEDDAILRAAKYTGIPER